MVMFVALDQEVLVVQVFDDELMIVVLVDLLEDCFDGGVAFDQNTCHTSVPNDRHVRK